MIRHISGDWISKIKPDGFPALAVIERAQCRFFPGRLDAEGFKNF
jgi:hypothetical protein